jgi:hypothetical protein
MPLSKGKKEEEEDCRSNHMAVPHHQSSIMVEWLLRFKFQWRHHILEPLPRDQGLVVYYFVAKP